MEKPAESHTEEHEPRSKPRKVSQKEIEEVMRAAREKFNAQVRVTPVPKFTRDCRWSTVWGPNSKQDQQKGK